MSKRDAKIYLKAAIAIENRNERFCCLAIGHQDGLFMNSPRRAKFADFFGKKQYGSSAGWYGTIGNTFHQDCRVIALCLAAAAAETGDL